MQAALVACQIKESFLNDISLYPNPSHNYLFLKNSIELEAKVYDLNGRLILTEYITNKLDVSCLKRLLPNKIL